MKKNLMIYTFTLLFLFGCNLAEKEPGLESWRSEIIAVEKEFNAMAQEQGLATAFESFAAPDGVIMRNNEIFKGKEAIAEWFTSGAMPNGTLSWAPTFVDVSSSGDMAYTYGDFTFTMLDSLGNKIERKGIFHTVWKRQSDGNWKFVWD